MLCIVLYICLYVHCFLCLFHYVHMYIVPGSGNRCKYVYIASTPRLQSMTRQLGTQRSPFINPCWVFYSPTSTRPEQDHVLCLWDPWSPVYIVHLFTHNQPVASFYPSNPKVSISLSPVLMHRITCTCILLCFLGALAQAFFCRQPTQGSYWCLNIHLVSCIL